MKKSQRLLNKILLRGLLPFFFVTQSYAEDLVGIQLNKKLHSVNAKYLFSKERCQLISENPRQIQLYQQRLNQKILQTLRTSSSYSPSLERKIQLLLEHKPSWSTEIQELEKSLQKYLSLIQKKGHHDAYGVDYIQLSRIHHIIVSKKLSYLLKKTDELQREIESQQLKKLMEEKRELLAQYLGVTREMVMCRQKDISGRLAKAKSNQAPSFEILPQKDFFQIFSLPEKKEKTLFELIHNSYTLNKKKLQASPHTKKNSGLFLH